MKREVTFVTGERARIEVPDATRLPAPVATAVLSDRGRELEVNAAPESGLRFFLSATGSRLSASVTLRNGLVLRHGPLGGRAAWGRVYAVTVGGHRLYGSCGGRIALADLAGIFARATATPSASGPALDPGRGSSWARRVPSSVAQVVDLGAERGFLLDVRAAAAGANRAGGVEVAGGRLSRSGPQEQVPYLVLESERTICYAIPRPGTPADEVAEAMTRVRVVTR